MGSLGGGCNEQQWPQRNWKYWQYCKSGASLTRVFSDTLYACYLKNCGTDYIYNTESLMRPANKNISSPQSRKLVADFAARRGGITFRCGRDEEDQKWNSFRAIFYTSNNRRKIKCV